MPMSAPRRALPMPAFDRPAAKLLAASLAGAGLLLALFWPEQIWLVLVLAPVVVALLLALAFPTMACVAWLFAVGLTPDMWLADILGDGIAVTIVAVLKVVSLVLVGLTMLRFGPRFDTFNPGFAFAFMFAAGIVHGLHPNLDAGESFRTFLGSAAPFAFCFARLPRQWPRGVVLAVLCIPVTTVLLGAFLAAAGLRPVLVEGAGLRLQGAGHPAFLGGFALTACYAALLELLRTGAGRYVAWLALNLTILGLSGARAPLAIGIAVIGLSLLVAPTSALAWSRRLALLLCGGAIAAVLVSMAGVLGGIRIFQLLATDADHLSGRDEIWPIFQSAWAESPWWGWGVGAGKVLLGLDAPIVRMLGTNAAHNEYLRIGVDGGYIGLALLSLCFLLWTMRHLRGLHGSDRWVLLLVVIGFAVHSSTDNTLIATTSSVLFAWMSAVFARGAHEAEDTPRQKEPR